MIPPCCEYEFGMDTDSKSENIMTVMAVLMRGILADNLPENII
jgi:hypothetical protein